MEREAMSASSDTLYTQFVTAFEADGTTDPLDYLRQAAPADRLALAHRIDEYLAGAPRRPLEQMPPDDPATDVVVDALMRSLAGASGMWPALLPRLRRSARMKRSELIDRLAAALGVSASREKVATYYHEMELGVLPPEGVSDRVLDALAGILNSSRERLREAGGTLSELPEGPAVVFTRVQSSEMPAQPPAAAPEGDSAQFDEVDRLFRGGH